VFSVNTIVLSASNGVLFVTSPKSCLLYHFQYESPRHSVADGDLESPVAHGRLFWNHRQCVQRGRGALDSVACVQWCRFLCDIQPYKMAWTSIYEGRVEGQGHGQAKEARDVGYLIISARRTMLIRRLC
jgi:hypothetical protein